MDWIIKQLWSIPVKISKSIKEKIRDKKLMQLVKWYECKFWKHSEIIIEKNPCYKIWNPQKPFKWKNSKYQAYEIDAFEFSPMNRKNQIKYIEDEKWFRTAMTPWLQVFSDNRFAIVNVIQ